VIQSALAGVSIPQLALIAAVGILEKTQFLVEARCLSSHRPSVDGRHKPRQWIDHANDWDEEHEQFGDQ
jgi:hypothetical protein